MIEELGWLKLIEPALNLLRSILSWAPGRGPRLIFILQDAHWRYVDGSGTIDLHALHHVTNTSSRDAFVVTAIRLRPAGFRHFVKRDWRSCYNVQIADQGFFPVLVGPSLPPRTVAVMSTLHLHPVPRPAPNAAVRFLLEVRNQRNQPSRTRIRALPRSSYCATAPPPTPAAPPLASPPP
jgi:hypothetical protein